MCVCACVQAHVWLCVCVFSRGECVLMSIPKLFYNYIIIDLLLIII